MNAFGVNTSRKEKLTLVRSAMIFFYALQQRQVKCIRQEVSWLAYEIY